MNFKFLDRSSVIGGDGAVKLRGSEVRSSRCCFSVAEIGLVKEKSVRVVEGDIVLDTFSNFLEETALDFWIDSTFDCLGLIISIFFFSFVPGLEIFCFLGSIFYLN